MIRYRQSLKSGVKNNSSYFNIGEVETVQFENTITYSLEK